MKRFRSILLLASLLIAGCTADTLTEQQETTLVLTGVLINGEIPADIHVFTLTGLEQSIAEISDAEVLLESPTESGQLSWTGSGYDLITDPWPVESSAEGYRLIVRANGQEASAWIVVPPSPVLQSMSSDTYVVDPDLPGDQALFVDWQGDESLRYVLTLSNLEPAPVALPFDPSGLFSDFYALPVVESFADLGANYFSNYGHHRITIYSIDLAYEDVYFFAPNNAQNLLREGPDNVVGGKGYVAGAGALTLDFWMTE